MQKVIYGNSQGIGIILYQEDKESDYFENQEFKVVNETLTPDHKTTLNGMFNRKVIYKVNFKNHKNCMVFYIGTDITLFNELRYYQVYYWITANRIVNKYSFLTARNFNWIDNKWK